MISSSNGVEDLLDDDVCPDGVGPSLLIAVQQLEDEVGQDGDEVGLSVEFSPFWS
jgi:hypothetical protein